MRRPVFLGAVGGGLATGVAAVFISTASPALGPWTIDPTDPAVSLDDVEREVITRYPVPDVAPSTLARLLAAGQVVLFDVRTAEEYAAGHLPGAIRVDPDADAADIVRLHGHRFHEGPLVFYCAVGVRSSQLMMRNLQQVVPHARAGVYNLRGGVFRWTADGRSLVRGAEPGHAHPYDENWGQLLARTTAGP